MALLSRAAEGFYRLDDAHEFLWPTCPRARAALPPASPRLLLICVQVRARTGHRSAAPFFSFLFFPLACAFLFVLQRKDDSARAGATRVRGGFLLLRTAQQAHPERIRVAVSSPTFTRPRHEGSTVIVTRTAFLHSLPWLRIWTCRAWFCLSTTSAAFLACAQTVCCGS